LRVHFGQQGLDASRAGKSLEITSSNSRASARGMAAVMAMLANGGEIDGVRVLSEAGRDRAIAHAKKDPYTQRIAGPQGQAMVGENVQGGWGRNPSGSTWQYVTRPCSPANPHPF